jgi:hypothetical protein
MPEKRLSEPVKLRRFTSVLHRCLAQITKNLGRSWFMSLFGWIRCYSTSSIPHWTIRSRFSRIYALASECDFTLRLFHLCPCGLVCARVDIFQGPFITGESGPASQWHSGEMHFKEARADQFAAKLSLCKAALALRRTGAFRFHLAQGRTDGWAKRKHACASYLATHFCAQARTIYTPLASC